MDFVFFLSPVCHMEEVEAKSGMAKWRAAQGGRIIVILRFGSQTPHHKELSGNK